MDANGNGMIDPDESQGRASFFLRRVMPDADFSRPIPIDQVKRSFEQARERWSGPPRGPEEAGRTGERDSGGGPSSSQPQDSSEPLIPGFGNQFSSTPVPGFDGGSPGTLAPVKISEEDRRRAGYYLQRYDANHDGFLTRDEARQSRRLDDFPGDSNGDGRLTTDELSAHFARGRLAEQGSDGSRSGGDDRGRQSDGDRGGPFSRGGEDGRHWSATASSTSSDGRKSYRFLTAEERLPEGLPAWFRQRDADHDGQITMAEFTSDWTEELVATFNRFDGNQDGIVTPEECLAAGSTEVAVITSKAAVSQKESAPASETDSSGIDPKYLQYAEGIIRKYDKSGDGVLASDEWSEMSKSPAGADADRNGRLTATEYATWLAKQ